MVRQWRLSGRLSLAPRIPFLAVLGSSVRQLRGGLNFCKQTAWAVEVSAVGGASVQQSESHLSSAIRRSILSTV